MRQDVELLDDLVVELPAALIGRKQLLPIGRRAERVPTDQHGARRFAAVEPQQKIGEADDRAGAIAIPTAQRFRQRVVGAMGERVAVDDQQWPAHAVLTVRKVTE